MTATVSTYNTIVVPSSSVTTIVTQFAGPYYYNILNLGPATLYYRGDADPAPGDPQSLTLPALYADNVILVPEGTTGLRFIAGTDNSGTATISLRLVRG